MRLARWCIGLVLACALAGCAGAGQGLQAEPAAPAPAAPGPAAPGPAAGEPAAPGPTVGETADPGGDAGRAGDPGRGAAASAPPIPQQSARLEDQVRAAPPEPTGLRIPALGVDAAVTAVGVDGSGQMAVPGSGALVAWYQHGPAPGQPGSAVLAGHVDFDGREGVFFRLTALRPGDVVTVRYADGTARDFAVTGSVTYAKEELPVDQLFAREGAPVLTLVTCGGAFDRAEQRYLDNTVVSAAPLG